VSPLSSREQAVCDLVVQGLVNKEIAKRLKIGVPTVNKHIASAMRKLGARTKVHLAVIVLRGFGLLVGVYDPEAEMLIEYSLSAA
jgi:DNA-binding CsgD family transcriptional regulator